jgi:ubiquinone/menaquinone biosynthesis C-methylase UbiE
MSPVSFDRAAEYYDATRGYAEGSAERIRDAIAAYAGAGQHTRFLELGVGTGRIALPFIRAGYDYTGVDISPAMMQRLAGKLAGDAGASAFATSCARRISRACRSRPRILMLLLPCMSST